MSDIPTTYTRERNKQARDRAAMAAMIDVDSFLLALDDIEHLEAELAAAQAEVERLREYSGQVSNIRAGLSREVEAQIILDARKPLEYEVARLRAQLESAKTWMPQWAIDVIEAFGVTK